jgi:outer membrane protein assembly factor BamB
MRNARTPLTTGRMALAGLVLGLALGSVGCSMFEGDDEPKDVPAELADFDATLRIKEVWSTGVGGDSEYLRLALGPASDGSRIYAAAHDGTVSAFDAAKGRRLWRVDTELPLSAGPATDGDLVVVGSSDGEVVALKAADGSEAWRKVVPSEILATPAIAGSVVLVRTVDGKLTALNVSDGSQLWFVQQVMPRLTVRGTGAPVVVKDMVVAGFDNGKLAGYQLADGAPAWEAFPNPPKGRNEIARLNDINATVRVVSDDIYVLGYQGKTTAAALESGQALWAQDVQGYAGLAVDLENIYVSGSTGELFALSRLSGNEIWKTDSLKFRDVTGPTAYQNSIVVGDFEGYVHFFDPATGTLQARVRAGGGRVTSPPLVANDILLVQTDGGDLTAYRQVAR